MSSRAPRAPVSRTLSLATGLDCHLLEWGQDRPELDHTVILIHGFLDLAWGWEQTAAAGLCDRFHLIAPDMRGHGDSDWIGPGGYYHFLDYLADLEDIIAQTGRSQVSLVGHSMGGSIAAYFAGAFPEAITRLALLEGLGPPEPTDTFPKRVDTWLATWRNLRGRGTSSYASVAEAAARLRKHDRLLSESLSVRLAEVSCKQSEDGRFRFKHDPLHTTTSPTPFRVSAASEFWSAIRCPVLLIEGSESVFRHASEQTKIRSAYFANHRSLVIDGAGHMMQRHQPERLAAMLEPFLRG